MIKYHPALAPAIFGIMALGFIVGPICVVLPTPLFVWIIFGLMVVILLLIGFIGIPKWYTTPSYYIVRTIRATGEVSYMVRATGGWGLLKDDKGKFRFDSRKQAQSIADKHWEQYEWDIQSQMRPRIDFEPYDPEEGK